MSFIGFLFAAAGGAQEAPELPAPRAEPVGPAPGATTLSLAHAVSLALEHNFGILSQADSVTATQVRESTAQAQFHPKLTPRYQRGPNDDQAFSLEGFQRLPWSGATLTASGRVASTPKAEAPFSKAGSVNATLTQPLLRGFGPNATYFDLTNSRRVRQDQDRSFELARQALAVRVAEAFYQVIKQRQLLEVARQSLARNESLKTASEARVKVGLASKLDLLRAEIQASQAQEAMVSAQAELESALERFRVLLGFAPGEPVEPEAVMLSADLAEMDEPLEVLLERARTHRLELQAGRDQVEDARRAAKLARQNLLPQLDLSLSLSQAGIAGSYGDALRSGDRRWNLFLSTSYPLDRSADRASRALAELDLAARQRGLKQQEFDIDSQVRGAVRAIERIRKSVDLQRQSVEFAEQQHRLATLRYQRGLASNFDVVEAEDNLVASRTALVNLITDYQVARIELMRLTGTLDVTTEFGS